MKQLIDFITYILLLLIGFISSKLTIGGRKKFGELLGDLIRLIGKKRRVITFNNIDNAFPNESKDWKLLVVRDSYRNLCITIVELLAIKSLKFDDISRYIEIGNVQIIHEAYNEGKGILFLSGHFGNWELLAHGCALLTNVPMLIVVKPISNQFMNNLFNSIRTIGINQVVPADKAAVKIFKTLKQGGVIALLADQSATYDKDIFVDFFGRPAATYEAPAELALRFKVPLIMGFSIRKDDGTYFVKLLKIEYDDLEFNPEGVRELTKRHVKVLEDIIREYPGHWAWVHRRWKHTPVSSDSQ